MNTTQVLLFRGSDIIAKRFDWYFLTQPGIAAKLGGGRVFKLGINQVIY